MKKQTMDSRNVISYGQLRTWMFFVIFLISLCFSENAKAAGSPPTIEKIQLINDRDIEIYWSEEMEGAGWVESKRLDNHQVERQEQNYTVTVDGREQEFEYYYWYYEEEGYEYEYKSIVYYNERNSFYPDNPDIPKTTLRLTEPVSDLDNLPEIKVSIKGNKIKAKSSGVYVPEQMLTVTDYVPFYQKERVLDCGVKVTGTAKVRDEAMDKAAEMLKVILANETLANRMGAAGCKLGIYGEGEIAYDIPEHRFEYDENYLYVEGFGGTQLASIRDANVLRLRTGNYTTGYPNESILTHEFAHTIYNYGLTEEQQTEFLAIFNSARAAGKWDDSYAGSNKDEYFATLSAIWFNAMDDTYDGNWDGVRGPINTRAELKVYDKEAYDFLSRIYVSDQYLPEPWANGAVPDNNTYPGTEPDDSTNPGGSTNPGDSTNPGGNTNPGDSTNPGENTNPGDSTNPGGNTNSGDSTNTDVNTAAKNYTVTFSYQNGKHDVKKTVKEGEKVSAPSAPQRKGYLFKGWYLGQQKYSFDSRVTIDITLQAKWEKVKVGRGSVKSLKAQKGKKMLVIIKKLKKADGYKITYAKNKKLTKGKKIIYTSSIKKTIKKFKTGAYYVGVQAYKKDSTGRKVIGKMSVVRKVIVKN